jgi:hypothetical protein
MSYRTLESLRAEAWEKFTAMEMFFVKVSVGFVSNPPLYRAV